MKRKILKNKPLIEAIFELRWKLSSSKENLSIDPHYKILIGQIFHKLKSEYPFHEQLPAALIPDEMSPYVIQHRFRTSESKWPLIQIGPGILTLNDTDGYTWDNFEKRINNLTKIMIDSYPEKNKLLFNNIQLRYIDGLIFDFNEDVFKFIKERMKTQIKVYERLFEKSTVENKPFAFDLRFTYPLKKPSGVINLRFFKGEIKKKEALLWETIVHSYDNNTPKKLTDIEKWIIDAHNISDDWFFKIISGDLERSFS
ncbi:MAG: TIGR04255 family protein [bacterium]